MDFPWLSPNEKEGIETFKRRVAREFGERAILFKLFGSKARNESWEESDTDILVLVKNLRWEEKNRMI